MKFLAGLGVGLLFFLLLQPVHAQVLEKESPSCDAQAVSAARDGDARNEAASVYLMARYYSTGKCFAGDGPKAIAQYQRAAALNYPPAFYNLGLIAAAHQDYSAAEALYLKGVALGHRGCELMLGILYSFPIPGVGDDTKAYAWLSFTASRNDDISPEAASILSQISGRLHPDRAAAADLVQTLKVKYGAVPAFKEPSGKYVPE